MSDGINPSELNEAPKRTDEVKEAADIQPEVQEAAVSLEKASLKPEEKIEAEREIKESEDLEAAFKNTMEAPPAVLEGKEPDPEAPAPVEPMFPASTQGAGQSMGFPDTSTLPEGNSEGNLVQEQSVEKAQEAPAAAADIPEVDGLPDASENQGVAPVQESSRAASARDQGTTTASAIDIESAISAGESDDDGLTMVNEDGESGEPTFNDDQDGMQENTDLHQNTHGDGNQGDPMRDANLPGSGQEASENVDSNPELNAEAENLLTKSEIDNQYLDREVPSHIIEEFTLLKQKYDIETDPDDPQFWTQEIDDQGNPVQIFNQEKWSDYIDPWHIDAETSAYIPEIEIGPEISPEIYRMNMAAKLDKLLSSQQQTVALFNDLLANWGEDEGKAISFSFISESSPVLASLEYTQENPLTKENAEAWLNNIFIPTLNQYQAMSLDEFIEVWEEYKNPPSGNTGASLTEVSGG